MFSEEFAKLAFEHANLRPSSLVLDSWLGAGTTAAIGAQQGHRVHGSDINPAMVAIAAGRCLSTQEASAVVELLHAAQVSSISADRDDPLQRWFSPKAVGSLRAWKQEIDRLFPASLQQSRGFAYTALFEAARRLALTANSKNPTWTKKPALSERIRAGANKIRSELLASARKRIALCSESRPRHLPVLAVADAGKIRLSDQSVDFVLTSPPYCTRIDYAVMTAIELAVLGIGDASLSALRDASMGTSTIRGEIASPHSAWGPSCLALLRHIECHPSKSSKSYYLKTFVQYFADLHRSLLELNRCLKNGGQAVLVVQDSLYKGVRVDLATITTEMSESHGWSLRHQFEFPTVRSMRRVNSRSRRYYADLDSSETVLWFDKT